jgi:hypothetical protein
MEQKTKNVDVWNISAGMLSEIASCNHNNLATTLHVSTSQPIINKTATNVPIKQKVMTMPTTSTEAASGPNFCHPRRSRTRDVDEQASLFLRKAYHVVSNCPPHLGTIQSFRSCSCHPRLNLSHLNFQVVGLQAERPLL